MQRADAVRLTGIAGSSAPPLHPQAGAA